MINQKAIQELYSRLNINNADITVRNYINEGTLENRLNTNYSAIYPEQRCTAYSTGIHKELKI